LDFLPFVSNFEFRISNFIVTHLTSQDIVSSVFNAGIVGAGGGGFPTHVKLQAKVDAVLANGSECEPLLLSDKTLMKTKADDVVEGLTLAMKATGATRGIIAVKGHYEDVVAALTIAIKGKTGIQLHLLENYYPAGDEFLTVYDVTKRIIPEGGLPLHVGVVVCNVATLFQIAQAASGKVVTERLVTVVGEVKKPCVIEAPIGTTYNEMIRLAGGLADPTAVLIDGGPMMGTLVTDVEAGIAKTTSGILALPKESLVVRQKMLTIGQMVKLSKAACCQCLRCTDLCPRNLLGHNLFPHMTMRTIDYNLAEPTEHITSAFLCSQCGMCEYVACDSMRLSPKRVYAAYRKELVERGVKNPHTRKIETANEMFEGRKVAVDTVLKKLDLMRYIVRANTCLPASGGDSPLPRINPNMVRIPTHKHVGTRSMPVVKLGQKIHRGDLIAQCLKDALGANYHASIDGKVTEVGDGYIEIIGD
jgi:Na+-translocating ferredoxin:NAD+ oxidoreductase RnfC subunit